ncbi:hypothetical protein [Pasteuria penetrans]|uniref:hypothetical protein n=1 Tax=Pasteuria penetrans TaxID=86005 RepID=UPI001CAA621E|nr:hypothetical protein [Pasteuria penetrans]
MRWIVGWMMFASPWRALWWNGNENTGSRFVDPKRFDCIIGKNGSAMGDLCRSPHVPILIPIARDRIVVVNEKVGIFRSLTF